MVLIPWNGKIQGKNWYDVIPLCSKDLNSDPKIQMILEIYKGRISQTHFSILKEPFSQNRIHRCNCLGPEASLNIKIVQIGQCHILMSYSSLDVICTYDIS
jgi:hypothetical protein